MGLCPEHVRALRWDFLQCRHVTGHAVPRRAVPCASERLLSLNTVLKEQHNVSNGMRYKYMDALASIT